MFLMQEAYWPTHLLAVDCEDLEHRVIPHHPWSATAVENLVLGWEKIIRRVLPADLHHGKVKQDVEARGASSMAASDSAVVANKIRGQASKKRCFRCEG